VPATFLESLVRPLLVLHAVLAIALAGAATHLALASVRWLRTGKPFGRSAALWSRVTGATYTAAFAVGLLMYPTYRYRVRGLYLDRYEPWASNLFDIKENLFGLGLPLALALFFVGGRLARAGEAPERSAEGFVVWASLAVWLIFAASSVMGFVVTTVKGV